MGGVPIYDQDTLAVCSVRYALGRMTYVVSDVARIVSRLEISEGTALVLARDIARALREGRAGMEMDVERWRALLDYLTTRWPAAVAEVERDAATFPGISDGR